MIRKVVELSSCIVSMTTLDIMNIGEKYSGQRPLQILYSRGCCLERMILSIGSQPYLANNITKLSRKEASGITLARRFCSPSSSLTVLFKETVKRIYGRCRPKTRSEM